jgi:DNA polymerase-3 subunit alpha
VRLEPEQAADITVQHRLRECLQRHRLEQDAVGLRVPVLALVGSEEHSRLVRLGPQFCVSDAQAAVATLASARFHAWLRSPLAESAPPLQRLG